MNKGLLTALVIGFTTFVTPVTGHSFVQSYDNGNQQGMQVQQNNSIGGGFAAQQQQRLLAAQRLEQQQHAAYQDQPTQGVEDYRGYNGRTIDQAFLKCKYESYRGAAPGDNSKDIFQKIRIRMYMMNACMSAEGFFKQKAANPLDSVGWSDVFF